MSTTETKRWLQTANTGLSVESLKGDPDTFKNSFDDKNQGYKQITILNIYIWPLKVCYSCQWL